MSTPAPDPATGSGGPPTGAAGGGPDPADAGAARKRNHAITGTLAATLCLEALTVLFVPRAVARAGDGGLSGTTLTVVLVVVAALLLAAGLVRRRAGLALASALQVAVTALGLAVGAMYFLGLLFACIWAYMLWIRQEILRAAAEHAAASRPAPGAGGGIV